MKRLGHDDAGSETRKIAAELKELRARQILAKHKHLVLEEIDRKKKHAAYGLCIDDTRTQTITRKSTAVTRRVVTKRLKDSFRDELLRLNFSHVEVELQEVGGSEGVFYHKLALSRAPGVELARVVSEGEQRCLTIAAFFAELSTADNPSGIVFDDPGFLAGLQVARGRCAKAGQRSARKTGDRVHTRCGVSLVAKKTSRDLAGSAKRSTCASPANRRWCMHGGVALGRPQGVQENRILEKRWPDANKLYRDGHLGAYERDAREIYGYLREAWERGLEEVLLNGVVERYRPTVETQRVSPISDITLEDCTEVETGMTKCSKWLRGHDQAAAARADVPGPTELKSDLETFEAWVRAVRKRRA